MPKKTLRYATLVRTLQLEPIPGVDPEMVFRCEIFRRSAARYFVQFWRVESYRLQPSFTRNRTLSDDEVAIRDTWGLPEIEGTSVRSVIQKIERLFASTFPSAVRPAKRRK